MKTSQRRSENGPGRPFQPGQSGNPAGRPPGSRNRTTLAAQELLDGEAEALTRKVIELALIDDIAALRLCMDRILPVRRDRPLQLELPNLESIDDAGDVVAAIISAVGAGDLGIGDAMELAKLVELYVRTKEASIRETAAEIAAWNLEEDRRIAKDRRQRGFG